MVKKILSVAIVGAFALSGCSQKEVEVKAPEKAKATKATDVNVTAAVKKAAVKKAAPKVVGGAVHVPFSEMMK